MTEQEKDGLRAITVDVLDHVARLAIRHGVKPMKLWDMVQTRMRSAARRSGNAEQWCSHLLRGMLVTTPDAAASYAIDSLVAAVGPDAIVRREWLQLIQLEGTYLLARLRVRREDKKAAYAAQQAEEAAIVAGDTDDPKPTKARKSRAKKTDTKTETPAQPAEEQPTLWSE
jgi:hypothetical protein